MSCSAKLNVRIILKDPYITHFTTKVNNSTNHNYRAPGNTERYSIKETHLPQFPPPKYSRFLYSSSLLLLKTEATGTFGFFVALLTKFCFKQKQHIKDKQSP